MSFAPRPKRSASGHTHFHFLVAPGMIAIALFASACSPKPQTQSDPWRLTPPRLVSHDEQGVQIATALDRTQPHNRISVGGGAVLKFAEADLGLELRFESRCGEERHEGKMTTGSSVSLARLIPPLTMSKSITSDSWVETVCRFDFLVMNNYGSSHQFTLEPVSIGRVSQTISKTAKPLGRLRLVCPEWWVEESDATDSDFKLRLEMLSNSHAVHGTDSRRTNRRPFCTVANLTPDGDFESRGFYSPEFTRPPMRVTRTVLTHLSTGGFFLQRPFMKWNLQNNSNADILVFLATSDVTALVSNAVKLAGADEGWTKPVQTPIAIVDTAVQSRTTSSGRYLRLPARSEIDIQMNFHRRAWCMVEFGEHWSPGFFVALSRPVIAQTLAIGLNESDLRSASDSALDAMPRDTQDDLLLDSAAVSVAKAESIYVGPKRTDLPISGSKFTHRDLNWFGCYEGSSPMEGPLVTN